MGRKVSDGKALNVVIPAYGVTVEDGELVRVGGLNGCIIGEVTTAATDRSKAMDADTNAIHSITVPAAINPAVGTLLYWALIGSFQYGPVDLLTGDAVAGDAACFFVTAVKVDGVIRGRVINGAPGVVS